MEKQLSFGKGVMEKQKSFRIVMERQVSFSVEKKRAKESPGKRGDSPLHLAARAGNLEKVKEIVQKFDDNSKKGIKDLLSLQNQQGETALYIAAENGHTLVVAEMLKHLDIQMLLLWQIMDMMHSKLPMSGPTPKIFLLVIEDRNNENEEFENSASEK
ncbi:hypothetical protein K7X08_010633 [Anisodus acutangulus]|uniref:Uncharacterized protein n=1 Tax=Anisodus acutangulus TaxID=402998 RepID=A0A9Q1LXA3_9SOLA|nr:hypothetical protein K7X08_010633 [Anisodus acutangulus]